MPRTTEPSSIPTNLAPCPRNSNCVSSQDTRDTHRVAPFICDGSCEGTLARLQNLVASTPGVSIVVSDAGYLHAEYTSPFLRFVDDLELLVDSNAKVIQVRSASRVGTWDLGANRRRVEGLRRRFTHLQE